MPSLSTTYGVSILLASIAGIGSAFLANKFVPLTPPPTQEVIKPEPPSINSDFSQKSYSEVLPNSVPAVPGVRT